MKNLNKTFCFKKKLFNLYSKNYFVCFQSFFSFQDLQNKLGDHKVNFYLFNINNFWHLHYPNFYCSKVNTYGIFFKKNWTQSLNSLLANADINIFYILKNNRFYNVSYFQNIISYEKTIYDTLTLALYFQNLIFFFELKKVFTCLMFLITTNHK